MKQICALFLICISINTNAQDLLNYIPENADRVLTFKGAKLSPKVSFDEITKADEYINSYGEYKDKIKDDRLGYFLIPIMYENDISGINIYSDYHFFNLNSDTLRYSCFISKVENKELLNNLITGNLSKEAFEEKTQIAGYDVIYKYPHVIAWNSSVYMQFKMTVSHSFLRGKLDSNRDYYYEEIPESERTEAENQKDEIKEKLIIEYLTKLFTLNNKESILQNSKFNSSSKGDYDVSDFTTTAFNQLNGIGNSRTGYSEYTYATEREIPLGKDDSEEPAILADNFSFNHINLTENGLEAKNFLSVHKDLVKPINNMLKGKASTKVINLIQGENIQGYYSFAINPYGTLQLLDSLKINYMNSIPGASRSVASFLNTFKFFIKEKEVMKIAKGNGILAVTGVSEITSEYSSFEYDQKDNSRIFVTKTKKESKPEFFIGIELGNPKLVNNFIKNLAEEESIKAIDGGFYELVEKKRYSYNKYRSKDGESKKYMCFVNNVLVFSNNEETIKKLVNKELKKELNLSKVDVKRIKSSNFVSFWNLDNAYDIFSDEMMKMNSSTKSLMRKVSNKYQTLEATGPENNDNLFYFNYSLKSKKEVSFNDLYFNLMNYFIDEINFKSYDYRN